MKGLGTSQTISDAAIITTPNATITSARASPVRTRSRSRACNAVRQTWKTAAATVIGIHAGTLTSST